MCKNVLTVVTVVFNAEDEIERTIDSVVSQTFFNSIEYIVIDGGSTDTTVEKIEKHSHDISYWISESDGGIYHAMNKAINLSSGEWICFMNAGDVFVSADTVEDVFHDNQCPYDKVDFIYGSHYLWQDSKKYLVATRPLDLMWQRICFCHQSLFTKTALLKKRPFDLSYKIVCDYHNYFSRYMENKVFYEVNRPVSIFLAGGFSDVNFFLRTRERYKVVRAYKNDLSVHTYYFRLILKHYYNKLKNVLSGK